MYSNFLSSNVYHSMRCSSFSRIPIAHCMFFKYIYSILLSHINSIEPCLLFIAILEFFANTDSQLTKMKIFIGLPLFLKLLSTGAVGLEALFKRESIGNRNITEGQFIRHNIITTTSTRGLDECALKSKLIFNSWVSLPFWIEQQIDNNYNIRVSN